MPDLTAFAQSNIAARLRAAASRGALSHALILSGPGDRSAAARYAAAGYECTSAGEKPCLSCPQCRKVMADIHPDVIFVRDSEHRDISADTVRAARADTHIRPNEGARKVYIFEDCAVLTERDQNILLKTVEEGPPYCAFLFCAENPAALLQTIRSRCVEVKLGGEEAAADTGREEAVELCRLTVRGNAASRAAFVVKLENSKRKREEVGALLESARLLFADALLASYGAPVPPENEKVAVGLANHCKRQRLLTMIDLLNNYRRSFTYNVGVGTALGGFAVEWENALK